MEAVYRSPEAERIAANTSDPVPATQPEIAIEQGPSRAIAIGGVVLTGVCAAAGVAESLIERTSIPAYGILAIIGVLIAVKELKALHSRS